MYEGVIVRLTEPGYRDPFSRRVDAGGVGHAMNRGFPTAVRPSGHQIADVDDERIDGCLQRAPGAGVVPQFKTRRAVVPEERERSPVAVCALSDASWLGRTRLRGVPVGDHGADRI